MATSTRKKRKPAQRRITAASLGLEGLEKVVPLGDALLAVLEVVEDHCSRYPERAEAARRVWGRVVDRAFYDDHEGKEPKGRPRTAGRRRPAPETRATSIAKALTDVEKIVTSRLDDKGWPRSLGADERTVTVLAWERIKLRCNFRDTESLKRLKKARNR
jgi:hypothetical protein